MPFVKKNHIKTSKHNYAILLKITNSLHLQKQHRFGKCKELKEKSLDPTLVIHEKAPNPTQPSSSQQPFSLKLMTTCYL
jgi:hypothetical protein